MAAISVTNADFEQEVLQSDQTVLVDFWASWCGPCKMLSPVVEQISEERSDVKVCKVNVDEEPELAEQYGIMSIPALKVFKGGQVVNESMGAVPKAKILAML